jgi:hypothetical protein
MRHLQTRADDLAERLLVSELEMRRSRTLEAKLDAYRTFRRTVDRIDALRRDIEELHISSGTILAPLDRRAAAIRRSPAYRLVEWFDLYADVRWYLGPMSVDPARYQVQC